MSAIYGDIEKVIADLLRDSTAVDAYAPVRVGTDLIGYTSPDRWLLVTRTGGEPTLWRGMDNPQMKVTAYAEDKGTAWDLAATARDVVFQSRGLVADGLELYDIDEQQGLTWSPDEEDPTIPRYTFTLVLVTRRVVVAP